MSEPIGLRLLLVDDDAAGAGRPSDGLADVADDRLSIEVANGVAQAAAQLGAHHFDGVVLDLKQPDPARIDMLARIRAAAASVPIVVFADFEPDGELRRTAAACGAQLVSRSEASPHFLARGVRWMVQHQRSEALHRQFERLLSAIPDAVIVTNRFGVILFVNDAAYRLFAKRREDFVGELIGFAVREGEVSEIEVHRNRERRTCEMRVVDCEWNSAPAFLAIIRDVTEQKRLREQLRHSQKMEAVGLVAGGVAHDFNNLLQVMLVYAEMLRDGSDPADARMPYIVEILQSVDRARAMTAQLLAFSRKQPSDPAVLHPGDVVAGFHSMLRRTLPANIEIVTVAPDDAWPVWIDKVQLEQVLMNLAVNARDAMPSGGRFAIEIDNLQIGADGEGRPPGDYVAIRVSDTGSGIAPEHLDRIFDPFFTTKERGRGTGLGLSTCYGIITQAGGRLSVESKPEGGTEFLILLPRARQPAAPAPAKPALPDPAPGGETILVIEDDQAVMRATVATLERAGYVVLTAANGDAARRLLQSEGSRVDLVLSDVVMPQLGGPELADYLAVAFPKTPLIFMTGYSDYSMATEHGDHRIAEHRAIMKPFHAAELLAVVRSTLDERSV